MRIITDDRCVRGALWRRAVALVLLLPVSSAGCAVIGTQLGRERVQRDMVARAAVELAPVTTATATGSKGRREIALRYQVERSEPTAGTWVAAPLGMLVDAGLGMSTLLAARTGEGLFAASLALFAAVVLIVDPAALIALAIPDDWALPDGAQYLEPGPGQILTLDVGGTQVRTPAWIEPASWGPLGEVALEVRGADGSARLALADAEDAPVAGVLRVWGWPSESAPSVLGLPLRIYDLPTRPAACPLPPPLTRHHRVSPGLTSAVRTGLVLSRPGDAFSVASVDSTAPVSATDELLFEVDCDGESDVDLRIDVAYGCPSATGRGRAITGDLSVTVGDGEGSIFGRADVVAPRTQSAGPDYGASSEWVTISKRRLPAGRHTLHLSLTRRRQDELDLSHVSTTQPEYGEYVVFVGRTRTRPPPGELQLRAPRSKR